MEGLKFLEDHSCNHGTSLQIEAKEVDKKKHELYALIESMEEEENVLKKQQIDITNELDKFENVIKENQQRIKHWKKEVKEIPPLHRFYMCGRTKFRMQLGVTLQVQFFFLVF